MMARAYAEREASTMKNILVALDGSESATRALAMASDLAMRYRAVLHLVHVSPRPMVVSEGLKEFARAERVDLLWPWRCPPRANPSSPPDKLQRSPRGFTVRRHRS